MLRSSTLRRCGLAAVLAGSLAFGPVALVSAETPAEPAIDETEVAELIAVLLVELGLPEDTAGPIIEQLTDRLADRLNALIEEGAVDPEQVETFAEAVENGEFDEVVPSVVAETRERRDAFREAAESFLVALGIEVPEDGSLADAIAEAGLTRAELAELLDESGVELPEPPARPEPAPERPAEPTPRPPAPTTTQPPAPAPEPAEEPAPTPPAPDYPDVAPKPAPDYPTSGGEDPPPDAPAPPPAPQPEYPTPGHDADGTEPEEAL